MARNRNLQNRIEYLIFLPFLALFRALPRTIALRLGGLLGSAGKILLSSRRQLVLDNLSQAYPEKNRHEINDICNRTFRHIGISVAEMMRIDMFKGRDDIERYFDFVGWDNLEQAHALNKGVLIATAHLGFWEIGAFFLPLLGFPTAFVAKRAKNPLINDRMIRMRKHFGGQAIEARKGARQIVRCLQEGKCVGVLIDHHMHPHEAVQVPFFGRPAWTTPIITRIAMKRDIPVVPIFVYRTEDFRYKVEALPAVFLEGEVTDDTVTENTALLTGIIETAIRKEPSQWFWVHKRWKP